MSLRVCAEPGCPELTTGTRCEAHRKARRRERAKARSTTPEQRVYKGVGPQGRAWRRARAKYLRSHPICEDEAGCINRAEHVHHVDGQGPLGPRGLEPTNFQALCLSCHSRKTAQEQPGGWNARN